MIGHIEHGSDFGGLFRYLLAKDKGARIIGGNAAGRTPSELTQEFNNCADQRRTTKKPVKHLIVSFSHEDGYVTDEVKARIAKGAVEELGYTYNQYVVVDHHRDDPGHDWNHDHDHIHIAVNMITLDGRRVDDWQDKTKFESILIKLAVQEKLTQIAPSKNRKFKACSHGQTQRIKREIKELALGERTELPEIPLMTKLQAAIDKASEDRPDLTTFIGRLQNLDVDVRPNISDKGRKRISYKLGDFKIRGSKLHNGSFPKLISQRGIDFDLNRDNPAMAAACLSRKISIPIEKQISWSQIDLIDYLPNILKEDYIAAKKNFPQQSDDVKSQEADIEENIITDSELLSIRFSVESWQLNRPQKPEQKIVDNIQLEIIKLEKHKQKGKLRIKAQLKELEQLGKPYSLFNPFGVEPDIIEEKKHLIQLNQGILKKSEDNLTKAKGNLEQWQRKMQVYQDWCSSPKTQEMEELAQLLSEPEIVHRLNRIKEGRKVYDTASYILEQLGESEGERRYFQSKLYCIEELNQTLTISRRGNSSIIYAAEDNRESGGIVDLKKFDLSQQDKERLDESVRYLKQEEKQKERSKGFSIG